ncbi:MAG: RagB/SusD family nutrient uptake outer membrane protein [Dysgonamonadaceae bacterium]|jgi:hypothetical protein|nr:RagB/SusD family nutrient uptake outer membrane protein [Dysgonamonadaceae bacterium]
MKTIYQFSLILALFASACSSDLMDKMPLDKFSESAVWNDLNLTEAYVNYQYKVLPKIGWYEWIRAHQLGTFTDETVHKYGYNNVQDYWRGLMGPSLVTGIDVWRYHYQFIKGCNVFLQSIDKVPANSDDEKDKKARMEGEIYALRAWSYMDLAARYGGVVLVTEPFELDDDFARERSSFDETVDLVIDDLDKAIALLPESYSGDKDWGRITKGAAMAMKSRMLLYAASPLFNTSNDKSKWTAAAEAAKKVIDLGLYVLEPDYKQLFLENKNDEIILSRGNDNINDDGYFGYFGVVEGVGGGIDGNGYASGWSTSMVTQNMVDAFEMIDGTPFDWNNPEHRANPYKNRDPRFDASVTHDGTSWIADSLIQFWICEKSNNYTKNPFDSDFEIDYTVYGRNSVGNPGQRQDCPEMGYIYQKAMNPKYDTNAEQYPYSVPWIIFRYAEILLNYAEALYESGGSEDIVRTYLNQVRSRVGMPKITASGSELRKKIQHERRIELCFEAHRYFDARRWKTAVEDFSQPAKGIRIVKDKSSDKMVYNVFEFQQRTWPEKYYLQPIPQYELDKISLNQNPGY